jgi:hypothetical protein
MNATMTTDQTRADQLAALAAKHAAEIEKLQAEQKAAEALPLILGARLRMVHGKLYGVRNFALDVLDLAALLDYMDTHALPVYAWKGVYSGMYPHRPQTRDWETAHQTAEGVAIVKCSRAARYGSSGAEVSFFINDNNGDTVKLSFTAGGYSYSDNAHQKTRVSHELAPVPQFRTDITRHSLTDRPLSGYAKTGAGVAQHIFHNVDKQGADLNTLCTMQQVREYWTAE